MKAEQHEPKRQGTRKCHHGHHQRPMLRVLRACALTARTEITACARPSAGILADFGSPFFIRLDETAIFFGDIGAISQSREFSHPALTE